MKAGHSPNIERATRRIASAFGYGSCWSDGGKRPNANIEAADFGESPAWSPAGEGVPAEIAFTGAWDDDDRPASTEYLAVMRRSETLEPVGRVLVNKDWQTARGAKGGPTLWDRLTDEQRAELLAWERANVPKRDPRISEHRHWKRAAAGFALLPRARMDDGGIAALAFGRMTGPLRPWLELYALQDWSRWADVERFALACLPDQMAVEEGALRVLWPGRPETWASTRAIVRGMRRADFVARVKPAEAMLWDWLERAATAYNAAAVDMRQRATGSQGNGHRSPTYWRESERKRAAPCRLMIRCNRNGTANLSAEGVISREEESLAV